MLFARRLARVRLALPLAGLAMNACGDGENVIAPPTTGTLQVTTVTSGSEPDPDGYSIRIDAGDATAIGNAETRTFTDVGAGDHAVELGGLAANCIADDGLSQSTTLTAGTTSTVTFTVTCAGTTGSIEVTTVTTGAPLDPDGYSLSLDGNAGQAVGVNATRSLSDMNPGNHSVGLGGVASNCTIAEANPRTVPVAAGAEAAVSFTVTCAPPIGGIQWTLIPFPSGFIGAGLWASSASDLFVVGSSTEGRFVLHHDGHDWGPLQPLLSGGEAVPGSEAAVAVWGSSPNDVFAAGGSDIWHYNGTQWASAYHEYHDSYVGLGGTSAGDVFAVGCTDATPDCRGLIAHYDGRSWSRPSASPINSMGHVHDVWAITPGDAWAVGGQVDPFESSPPVQDVAHLILHYDGTSWSVNFGFRAFHEERVGFSGIWASASNDVFAVGNSGLIWHYDGSAWSPMTSPTPAHLRDVWGSSGSDVFAVGDAGILRYDGTSWSVINQTKATRLWGAGTDLFVLTEGGVLHGTR
jgi:hypothetical protein